MSKTGEYREMDIELIDEGDFIKEMNVELRKLYRELIDYEKRSGDLSGKAVLTTKLSVKRMKGSEQFHELDYSFHPTIPTFKKNSAARSVDGRLMCEIDGTSSLNDKDQMVLTYDRFGNEKAKVNLETGEVAEDEHGVVGKVCSES